MIQIYSEEQLKAERERLEKKAQERNVMEDAWHKGTMEPVNPNDCQAKPLKTFRKENGMKTQSHRCYNKTEKHGGLCSCFCGFIFARKLVK